MIVPVFNNSYKSLAREAYVEMPPVPVANPTLVALNEPLANSLGLDCEWLRSDAGLDMLSGRDFPAGAASIAQAYAGQQFGNWVPQLGDGRALMIGEIDTPDGQHFDLQLKGSGPTPFSRNGDGRAALGPVLREFLVSEAMSRLNVPTTRALAMVTTGQKVHREATLPGAILTRVAASHIRVGTFQYFAARQNHDMLSALVAHVIDRHFPSANGALGLLDAVVEAQASLIAKWLSIGFVHGVMNTDNMAVSGQTIDYGPCAFLDEYDPAKTFSSIDRGGRYAYANQPAVAGWNLAQFASSLLPVMSGDQDRDIEDATKSVNRFTDHFRTHWLHAFGAKIGLATPEPDDRHLIEDALRLMAENQADFTTTFTALTNDAPPEFLGDWAGAWRKRCAAQAIDPHQTMAGANPTFIPRNHMVEAAISAAYADDFQPFYEMHAALNDPYSTSPAYEKYRQPPEIAQRVTQTFCGT